MKFRIKTMFLLVFATAIVIWFSVAAYENHTIQIPRSPDRTAGEMELNSYVGDKKVTVIATLPAGYPCWLASNSSPPLSAAKAIEIASEKLSSIERKLDVETIDLSKCSLHPWSPEKGYWYWVVEFHVWNADNPRVPQAETLRLVVLMDRTCGAISLSSKVND